MKKTKKNYYVLYKIIRDKQGEAMDLNYITELNTYTEITSYLKIDRHDVKKMINNNCNNWQSLTYHKNYCIIKEEAF